MYNATHVVRRWSNDETTFAVVSAKVTSPKLLGRGSFVAALCRAVTEWVKSTRAGRDAWRRSSRDLNVGDLSSHLGDRRLRALLAKNGIRDLEAEIFSARAASPWSYDTVLVNETDDLE